MNEQLSITAVPATPSGSTFSITKDCSQIEKSSSPSTAEKPESVTVLRLSAYIQRPVLARQQCYATLHIIVDLAITPEKEAERVNPM